MERGHFILTTKPRSCGFTLAESLIASVVLAIAIVGVSGTITASQNQTASHETTSIAGSLARELMEEVCALPLKLPDNTPGWPGNVTNRALYDTIDDFRGYTDTVTASVARTSTSSLGTFNSASPPSTVVASGIAPTPTGGQFTRQVTVTYPTTVFSASDASGDFAIVTVTVTGMGGAPVTLSRLVTKTNVTR
jgi:prepilin-type N-terminal cleavage/methylation domain-containing protein